MSDSLTQPARLGESGKEEEKIVDNVVHRRIPENWEAQDDPEHLKTIRDRRLQALGKGDKAIDHDVDAVLRQAVYETDEYRIFFCCLGAKSSQMLNCSLCHYCR